MEQRPLGRSGLWVGRFALGTMTWGRGTDEYDARDQLAIFLDAGGTLLDTADVYADGVSEQLVGELVEEFGVRDQVVLATKASQLTVYALRVSTEHQPRHQRWLLRWWSGHMNDAVRTVALAVSTADAIVANEHLAVR